MSSYVGKHAEVYDIFYADKLYEEEAAFVHKCFQQYQKESVVKVLELACGTGSHALELEKFGYKILATDYSKDMLAVAKQKAAKTASCVDFRYQDMRNIHLDDGPFDAIYCLFDSIGYVETNDALSQVLRGVNRHLKANGLFVFEFWHAAAMLSKYEPVRVRRWSLDDGELLRISETEIDCSKQLANVTYTIYELNADGTYNRLQETQTNRYFLLQEMHAMLSLHGLELLNHFNGFSIDEKIDEDTWHIVAVARKVERFI